MSVIATFRFEEDFAQTLRCIPMSVRLKLDLCGIKLTLRQWSRLAQADRRWLARYPCETEADALSLQIALGALIAQRTSEPVRYLAVDPLPEWRNTTVVPKSINARSHTIGIRAPSLPQWRMLTPLQRFALLKLARESHESANFRPAMCEFGLLQADDARVASAS